MALLPDSTPIEQEPEPNPPGPIRDLEPVASRDGVVLHRSPPDLVAPRGLRATVLRMSAPDDRMAGAYLEPNGLSPPRPAFSQEPQRVHSGWSVLIRQLQASRSFADKLANDLLRPAG